MSSTEGVRSLWRGISSVALGAGSFSWPLLCDEIADLSEKGPAHAVYFATYEAVKQAMGGNEGNEHHPLAAGE